MSHQFMIYENIHSHFVIFKFSQSFTVLFLITKIVKFVKKKSNFICCPFDCYFM